MAAGAAELIATGLADTGDAVVEVEEVDMAMEEVITPVMEEAVTPTMEEDIQILEGE